MPRRLTPHSAIYPSSHVSSLSDWTKAALIHDHDRAVRSGKSRAVRLGEAFTRSVARSQTLPPTTVAPSRRAPQATFADGQTACPRTAGVGLFYTVNRRLDKRPAQPGRAAAGNSSVIGAPGAGLHTRHQAGIRGDSGAVEIDGCSRFRRGSSSRGSAQCRRPPSRPA